MIPVQHLEIDGIPIEILRKPIKNMHLRIYPPDGRVRVSAPLRLSLHHICSQIEAKREWLHAQRARIQTQSAPSKPSMQSGGSHYFLGHAYTLSLLESTQTFQIILADQMILLSAKRDASDHEKEAFLKQWYREQMQLRVPDLIKKWEAVIGVTLAEWGVKTMKTRWGSCNTRKRRIWLNLSLIKKPILCLEYVLVHELIHLLEASHNARFYRLMDQFMPEWRDHQKALYSC